MKMMKRNVMTFILVIAAILAVGSTCLAEILPPYGEGQIGLQAVVLCESLTLRQDHSASSRSVGTLTYGTVIAVQKQLNGWAHCFTSDAVDAGPAGWVSMDYLVINPAWYRTDEATPVYAWNDTAAPRVARLESGTMLPILKDEGDWVIVSLRGATGWIHKTAADLASQQ